MYFKLKLTSQNLGISFRRKMLFVLNFIIIFFGLELLFIEQILENQTGASPNYFQLSNAKYVFFYKLISIKINWEKVFFFCSFRFLIWHAFTIK